MVLKTSKLCSAAVIAFAIAPLGAALAPMPAQATIACESDCVYGLNGGSSPTDPTPLSGASSFGSISFDQFFPAYWEFGFGGGALDISATYAGGLVQNSALEVFDAGAGSPFDSTSFASCVSGECANLSEDLLAGNYVVGISSNVADPGGNIHFGSPVDPPLPAPEPASLAIFGGALTGLGVLRRRRKKTA